MFRFNLIGLGMLLAAGIVYGICTTLFQENVAAAVGLFTLFTVDLAYRFRQEVDGWEKWILRQHGGMLIIMPAWAFALIVYVTLELST
ncbi:MAG: hypothetical protein AB8G95_26340 [Anaerolineae bacterium]